MKRFLLLAFLAIIGSSAIAQDSTFIFMTSTHDLYSVKVGGNCSTPYNFNGNNNIVTVWKSLVAKPLSIALDHQTLYVSNGSDSLFKGTFDSSLGLTNTGAVVGVFPDKGPSYGLTVDSKGVVYSGVNSFIDYYNPTTNKFGRLGVNPGWQIGGDLIFWGGKLYEVSRDSATKKHYELFQIDTSQHPAAYKVFIDFGTKPIFGIASVKQPCQYNQPYAMGDSGEIYPLNMTATPPTMGALLCNITSLIPGLPKTTTVYDAASNAESGLDQRPTAPANPVSPNDLCVGQPFSFAINVNDPTNDTLRWYVNPNVPPPGTPSVYTGMPVVNTNKVGSDTFAITEFNKVTKCESAPATIIVNIHPYPQKPVISPTVDTVCNGSTDLLTINTPTLTSGAIYQWFDNSIKSGTASSGNTTFPATTTGQYSVTATTFILPDNPNGCSTPSDAVNAKVLNTTIAYQGSPYCNNGLAFVSRNGDSVGGKYAATPAGIVIDSLTGTVDLTKTTPGTYTVTYTLHGGNFACPYTTNIKIQSTAATIKYASDSFCQVQSTQNVTLAGSGTITGGTYVATPSGLTIDANTGTITPATSTFGTYKVIYTYNDPVCGIHSDTTTVSIVNKVTPQVSITATADTICKGTKVIFTATPANGGTAPTYQWFKNNVSVQNSASNSYSDATLNNGDIITCTITSNAPCIANANAGSNAIKIVVTTFTPTISIAATSSSICANTSVTFTATPVFGGNTPIYQWQINNNNVGTNSNTYTTSNLNNSDVVTCILTSSLNCVTSPTSTSNQLVITVNKATASNNKQTICLKDLPYTWNGIKFLTAGTQTAHILNAAGCDSAATLNLSVDMFKLDSVGTNPVSPVANSISMGVTLYSDSIIKSATWTPAYLFSGNTAAQNITTPDTSFRIFVTGYSNNGCQDTTSKYIVVNTSSIFIPNAFTPSVSNSTNSTFKVYGTVKSAVMKVFNQWGQMIKELDDPIHNGWDGTYNGKLQPTGVYVYVVKITYPNNKTETRSGSINLIR